MTRAIQQPNRFINAAIDGARQLLPLLIMATLAAGTYWLVKRTLPDLPPQVEAPKRHTPDYFIEHLAATALSETGQTKYRFRAQKITHFEDDETAEVVRPAVRAYSQGQPSTTAEADFGVLSGDASILDLAGHAVINRDAGVDEKKSPPMQAHSEKFRVFLNEDKITTDQPVVLQHGGSVMTANSMSYDNVPRAVQLTGRVRGQIEQAPRPQ